MSFKTKATLISSALALILVFMFSGKIVEINKQGYYQVKQSAVKGVMTAKGIPGFYIQGFGTIHTYKAVATIGFGLEKGDSKETDVEAVRVVFNDGSEAKISALVRVATPRGEKQLIELKRLYSTGYGEYLRSGIVPAVKNAIKLAANLRGTQEAYTGINNFQQDVKDQLINGSYETEYATKEITNLAGELVKKQVARIKRNPKTGAPIRKANELSKMGCKILECVITNPIFDPKVVDMINKRKEASMQTEIAKQDAVKARQEAITAEEQGKKDVMMVKYEQEQKKIKAVVEAQQKKEVAKLASEEARFYKVQKLLQAEADASYKRKVMQADGALKQKIDAWLEAQRVWSSAVAGYSGNWVSQISMGAEGTTNGMGNAQTIMQLLGTKMARDLSLDMKVKK